MAADRARLYFARAVDGLEARAVSVELPMVVNEAERLRVTLLDAFELTRHIDPLDSDRLVASQIELLRSCSGLIARVRVPNRLYFGSIAELTIAHQLGLWTCLWTGIPDLVERPWPRYLARLITSDIREAMEAFRAFLDTE